VILKLVLENVIEKHGIEVLLKCIITSLFLRNYVSTKNNIERVITVKKGSANI
jgi:hypothetical protein